MASAGGANDAVPALVLNRAADDALGHPLFIRCSFGKGPPEQVFRVLGVIDDPASPDTRCRPSRPEAADTRGTWAAGGQLGGPQGAWR